MLLNADMETIGIKITRTDINLFDTYKEGALALLVLVLE